MKCVPQNIAEMLVNALRGIASCGTAVCSEGCCCEMHRDVARETLKKFEASSTEGCANCQCESR
jgi:hypothetical protein